jgi:hypothetical protein
MGWAIYSPFELTGFIPESDCADNPHDIPHKKSNSETYLRNSAATIRRDLATRLALPQKSEIPPTAQLVDASYFSYKE